MAPNVYELLNRAVRTQKIVVVLDAHLFAAGVHAYGAEAAFHVERLSDDCWSRLVAAAGLHPSKGPLNPSAETRAAVVAVYRDRPQHLADAVAQAKAVR